MKSVSFLLAGALLFSACSRQDAAPVNVHELNQQFLGAWNDKSADKAAALLADDAHFVQGDAHYKGKAEITDKWVKATLGTITDLKTSVVSSGTDANLAYEAGTFSTDVLPAAPGEPGGIGEGNYLLLWKKGTDGNWKLSYAQLEDLPIQAKGR